jgi:hypothetical protein
VFVNGRWAFDDGNAALHTLHHLGGGHFGVMGDAVRGALRMAG